MGEWAEQTKLPSCDLQRTRLVLSRESAATERGGFCACVENACLRTRLAQLLARTETLMSMGTWTDHFGKGTIISVPPTELRSDAACFRRWPSLSITPPTASRSRIRLQHVCLQPPPLDLANLLNDLTRGHPEEPF